MTDGFIRTQRAAEEIFGRRSITVTLKDADGVVASYTAVQKADDDASPMGFLVVDGERWAIIAKDIITAT